MVKNMYLLSLKSEHLWLGPVPVPVILQKTRPNGPNIAHLDILPQLGQNQFSGYCDIVIFMFWAIFSTGR